ncbi:MAG: SET domain-containing protein-lysine N-methyltransferase, partial [Flavobacteriales bacterium]|nr:SET domain-containing protein-lysine N-methyltransferase [Flavobacteriales bacterium]
RASDEGTKRKTVYPDDLLRYSKVWDKKLQKPFTKILQLEQPLERLLSQETLDKIAAIVSSKEEMASIVENYFPGAH